MQAILAVTVPFFALVLCGYLAGRSRVLPETTIPGLNLFVLYFALPCLLFRFGASLPVAQIINPTVIAVTLVTAVILVFATIALTRSSVPMKDAALGALTVVWPNTGFMGVPLLAALLGPAAAGPVITTLLVDLFFTSSLCIALAQSSPGGAAERLNVGTPAEGDSDQPAAERDRAGTAGVGVRGAATRTARHHCADAGRRRDAGGAVHDRHGAVARRTACPQPHAGARSSCRSRWRS